MRVSLNVTFWTGKMDRQAALMFGNRSRRLGFDFLKLRRMHHLLLAFSSSVAAPHGAP